MTRSSATFSPVDLCCSRKYAAHSNLVASRYSLPPFSHPAPYPVKGQGGSGRLRVGYVSTICYCYAVLWIYHLIHLLLLCLLSYLWLSWFLRYVSSDFGNHPLSHLMGSVFGMHNTENIEVCLVWCFLALWLRLNLLSILFSVSLDFVWFIGKLCTGLLLCIKCQWRNRMEASYTVRSRAFHWCFIYVIWCDCQDDKRS